MRSTVERLLIPCQQGIDSFLTGELAIVTGSLVIMSRSHALFFPATSAQTGVSAGRKNTLFWAGSAVYHKSLAISRKLSHSLDATSLLPDEEPFHV